MKVDMLTLQGDKAGKATLHDDIFMLPVRADLLHRAVRWQQAKRRAGTHKVLSRSEIARTNKKFVRQKGSGGARHGSKRVNIFRGGGVVHGPTPRDHSHDLPKKVRALALKTAFSAKQASGELIVIDNAKMDAPKTRALKDALAKFDGKSILVMDVAIDGNLQLAANNIAGVNCLPTAGANVYDLLAHDQVLITKDAAEALEVRFGLRKASGK